MASKVKVNTVETESGSTLTLGQSGDTVTLASGASQSGFGRTGTVDWDTTAKTAAFTAESGKGYFVNTSSAAITVTLPASPSAGDIVYVKDYTGTFSTNKCTVARNGSNIRGGTDNFELDKNNSGASFIYVDATEGWQVFVDGSDSDSQVAYIQATGGTITTCGDYKVHTFTGPGTFCVSCAGDTGNAVDYLVVAGGGGAGRIGAAGAGGFRVSNSLGLPAPTMSPLANPTGLPVSTQAYPITVGGGGTATCSDGSNGTDGANSIFSTITSAGGGGGASPPSRAGTAGGSGGGGAPPAGTGGAGNTPPVSPSQGNSGGTAASPGGGGGGGGAGGSGPNGFPGPTGGGGCGGIGSFVSPSFAVSCAGTPGPAPAVRYFAGGGGGARQGIPATPGRSPSGGAGGGGQGLGDGTTATAGTANTGGGGGANHANGAVGGGGSGIVIIRYKYQ